MTLHIPQKDSPSTYLTAAIDDNTLTISVADNSIFQGLAEGNITRLTLGFDTATTETVLVESFDQGNEITISSRGTPSYSWAAGTKIARVLTAQDITEIHDELDAIKMHDHAGIDWPKISTGGIENYAITPDKLSLRVRRTMLSAMTSGQIALDGEFVHGARVKYSPSEALYTNFHGFIPKDFVTNAVLDIMVSNSISMSAVSAIVTIAATRFSKNNIIGGLFRYNTTLLVPGMVMGEGYYRIQHLIVPLNTVMVDDFILGGIHLGPDASSNEVVFQGAFLEYYGR